MSNVYLPVAVPRVPNVLPIALSKEARYWSSVKTIASHTFHDPVTNVAFRPVEPHDLAVSFGFSISLISPGSGEVRKTLSRFRDLTYSPDFKKDGRLLVAGSGDGVVKIFDVNSRTPLRTLMGHKGPVRSAKFSTDGLNILSGSDDTTVRMWDLATSTCLFSLKDATDYVRAQNSSPASRHVWATGSADGKARLYDLRSKKSIFTLDHASQVDDIHILPGGSRAVTVGGPDVRVWDFFTGGKIVANLACHAKAVTSAAVDERAGRLVTAGLDGNVKVHDLESFQTQGIVSFGAQIMSLDVSADGRRFAVGMADGAVEIRAVKGVAKAMGLEETLQSEVGEREFEGWGRGFEKVEEEHSGPRPGTRRYFLRGPSVRPGSADVIVEKPTYFRAHLAKYDHSLKMFKHAQALDEAVASRDPAVFLAVVDELISRGNLVSALDGRVQEEVCPLLQMVRKYVRDPQYCKKMVLFMNALLDVCGGDFGSDSAADRLLGAILKNVTAEVKVCRELEVLQGGVDCMMWAPRATQVESALSPDGS